jgi:hypothetical protein
MTRRIPPELRTAARIARDGLRVTVTIGDVQYTVEPVDAKPQEAVASGGGESDECDALFGVTK